MFFKHIVFFVLHSVYSICYILLFNVIVIVNIEDNNHNPYDDSDSAMFQIRYICKNSISTYYIQYVLLYI
jgi:hypothetical protein